MKTGFGILVLVGLLCLGARGQEEGEKTGKAYIKSDPPGASIFLGDGALTPRDTGKKTSAIVELPEGKQVLVLSLVGYDNASIEVFVDSEKGIAKPETVVLSKPAKPTRSVDILFVLSDEQKKAKIPDDGWLVSIDGKPALDAAGQAALTPCTVKLNIGKHDVLLSKDGFKDVLFKGEIGEKTGSVEVKGKVEKSTVIKKDDAEKSKIPIEVKDLIGEWDVKVGKDYVATWKFFEDFTITSTAGTNNGTWSVKDKTIKIEWSIQAWETFYLPLKLDGTKGDSWRGGRGIVFAKKK